MSRTNSPWEVCSDPANSTQYDPLTGLANRSLFTACLASALEHAQNTFTVVTVLMVDIDGFTFVNSSLGCDIGDGLLRAVALRLQECMPRRTLIARFEGDQFAILIEGKAESDVRLVAERLAIVFQIPFMVSGQTLNTTAIIGVASSRYDSTAQELLRDVSVAVYDALKQSRSRFRSRISSFENSMLTKAHERMDLVEAMRSAMQSNREQFHLVYQPILDLQTGSLRGIEALLRWTHPQKGNIPPNLFIPLAEETGLIYELTDRVLREASHCQKYVQDRWPKPLSSPFVSVNLSPVVLQSESVASHILDQLQSYDIDPSQFAVEVTESVIARESQPILDVLSQLRSAGIRVLLDDFGTGYSSMAALMDLPVDIIKIDRAFVGLIETRSDARAIVKTLVNLADTLKLEVVCEGIENQDQCAIVSKMGDLSGQGYYLCRPLALEDLNKFLMSK